MSFGSWLAAARALRRLAATGGGLRDRVDANPARHDMTAAGPFELPPGASVRRDLAYGADPAQRLDLYLPPLTDGAALVVMVHGGAWMRGDKALLRSVRNKVAHWVGRGWALASLNYRMLPRAAPLAQADDVAQALAFVQERAEDWDVDAARIVLMGHSAGAHLVSLIAADAAIPARAGARPWCATVTIDSAAFDLGRIMNRPHYAFYDRAFGSDPLDWHAASPLHRLDAPPAVPWLTIHSAQRDDSAEQAQAFAAKAGALGGVVEVLAVDLTHGDLNDLLGAPGAYTNAVDAFLRRAGLD